MRKEYIPKISGLDEATNKCPICNKYIPLSEFNEHLRIEMLDPRYKEIKQEVQTRSQNITMVGGDAVAQNLANFAKRRPDLFGSVDDQLPEDDRSFKHLDQPKVIWDGQAANMSRTTANQAMLAQQQKRNMEDQMKNVSDKLGSNQVTNSQIPKQLIPNPQNTLLQHQNLLNLTPNIPPLLLGALPGGALPRLTPLQTPKIDLPTPGNLVGMTNAAQMGPQNLVNPLEGTKKIKTEEASLISEEIWLKNNFGPITLNVKVLSDETEEEWNLKGQLIQVQFDPTQKVGDLKEYLVPLLGGKMITNGLINYYMFRYAITEAKIQDNNRKYYIER